MSDIKIKYGTGGQTITITLASLASGSAQESTALDNATDLFLDALVQIKLKSGASSTSSTGYANVYAYGSVDDGTSYNGNATGTNASITLASPPNLRLIGVIAVVANATTYRGIFSVAAAFGGVLPKKWGIVVENQSGAALDSTGGNHAATYQGIYANAA